MNESNNSQEMKNMINYLVDVHVLCNENRGGKSRVKGFHLHMKWNQLDHCKTDRILDKV